MMLDLASSRRFSLAIAAGAALRLPGINRQELTIALAEWRERETDATVRGELDRVLGPSPDGVALYATSHPQATFWSRVRSWLFPPRLHNDALETVYLDLGSGEGLTYVKFPLPPATNRIEEEIRRRLNDGDGS